MIVYLIKSTLCMTLLWGFYRLVLQKEQLFRFNRFYLIGSLLFSCIVPKLSFLSNTINQGLPLHVPIPFVGHSGGIAIPEPSQWDYTPFIWGIYLSITAFFLIKYGMGLWQMIRLIKQYEKVDYNNTSIVLVPKEVLPQTFFSYIFLNKTDYLKQDIDHRIINHELAHARQFHSIDIVLIELLKAILWFNPILKLYSHSIRTNHEFLADAFALKSVNNISAYQELLLRSFTPLTSTNRFSSSVHYSLTKNRFIMMTKKTPLKTAFMKSGSALTMLFASFVLFSNTTTYAQEGATPTEVIEYSVLILDNYDQEGNPVRLSKEEGERMLVLYNKMDAGQQIVINSLRLPIPKSGITKKADADMTPPPPPFPHGAKYIIDGKEISVFEANMMLPGYKFYDIKLIKGKNGDKDEFHINRKKS